MLDNKARAKFIGEFGKRLAEREKQIDEENKKEIELTERWCMHCNETLKLKETKSIVEAFSPPKELIKAWEFKDMPEDETSFLMCPHCAGPLVEISVIKRLEKLGLVKYVKN